jgi:hypothetical protein
MKPDPHVTLHSDMIERLAALLPLMLSQTIIEIRLGHDFEPHGIASETWENVWSVTLPTVPGHWMSTQGWTRGKWGLGMKFEGRTLLAPLAQALAFAEWLKRHPVVDAEPKEATDE